MKKILILHLCTPIVVVVIVVVIIIIIIIVVVVIVVVVVDKSSFTHASNLHVERLKYSINQNYRNLILINIKNFAY